MKKVLMVACDNLGFGGIQNVIMSIVRELKGQYQFDAVLFQHDDTHHEKEFLETGRIFTIHRPWEPGRFRTRLDFYIRPLRLYRGAKKILRENGPYEVIHCHNYFEAGVFLLAAKRCGVPIRISHCHGQLEKAPLRKFLFAMYVAFYKKLIHRNATNLVACSAVAGQTLFGTDAPVQVIHNAIDLSRFTYTKKPVENPWSFLHVGRWCDVKNQSFLLKVFAKVCAGHPEATLLLVGYGETAQKQRLLDEIQSLGIRNAVTFYPADTDIPALLTKHNVFIFPSLTEGLGIVLIEAQATGMKCFASTGVPREADLGLVTYLPLADGAQAWAEQICRYVEQHGAVRREVPMDSYDIKNVAKQYAVLYDGRPI